jgi:error-prone DNA polymerase
MNRSGVSYRAESTQTVRIPLTAVDGLSLETARQIVQERLTGGKFQSAEDVYDRVQVKRDTVEMLIQAGAFDSLGQHRREATYQLSTLTHARPPGTRALLGLGTQPPELSEMSEDHLLLLDLKTTGLSASGRHALDAHRTRLRDMGCVPLGALKHGQQVWTAGLIVARQRPPTAKGFAFYVLEDASARIQAIISPDLWEAHRVLLRDTRALIVQGQATVTGQAITVKVARLSELPLGSWATAAD